MAEPMVSELPASSLLSSWRDVATFRDSYEAPLSDAALAPIEILRRVMGGTPQWATGLMALRNRIVAPLGLKTGPMNAPGNARRDPQVGDRLGLFAVFAVSDDELVVGVDDLHLDVRVSVLKLWRGGQPRYVLSTVVRTHNGLGRLYMLPVGRIHPLIVRSMMRRARV
jgi:hypothetical protein